MNRIWKKRSVFLILIPFLAGCSFMARTDLIAPAQGGTIPASSPGFKWNPVDKVSGYVLEISADSEFAHTELRAETAETVYVPDESLADGRYYCRVKPVFPNGREGRWSDPLEIIIEEKIPEWISPEQGTAFSAGTGGVLEWAVVPQANYYSLEWDSGSGEPRVFLYVYEQLGSPTVSLMIDPTLEGGDYAVRLRAHFPWGAESPWSAPLGITLKSGYAWAFNAPGHYIDGNWATDVVFFSADGSVLKRIQLDRFYMVHHLQTETGELIACGYFSDDTEYGLWDNDETKGIPAVAVFSEDSAEPTLISLEDFEDFSFFGLGSDWVGEPVFWGRLSKSSADQLLGFRLIRNEGKWEMEPENAFSLYPEETEFFERVYPRSYLSRNQSEHYLLTSVIFDSLKTELPWEDPRRLTQAEKARAFQDNDYANVLVDMAEPLGPPQNEPVIILNGENGAVTWTGLTRNKADESGFWIWGIDGDDSSIVLESRSFEGDILKSYVLPVPVNWGPLSLIQTPDDFLFAREKALIRFNPVTEEASIRFLNPADTDREDLSPLIFDSKITPEGILLSGCLLSGDEVVDNWLLTLDEDGREILHFYSSATEDTDLEGYSLEWD